MVAGQRCEMKFEIIKMKFEIIWNNHENFIKTDTNPIFFQKILPYQLKDRKCNFKKYELYKMN